MRKLMMIALTSMLMACGGNRVYYQYEHIDEAGWGQKDTITFTTQKLPAGRYHTSVCMRATQRYPYSDITISRHSTIQPSGSEKTENFKCHIYNNVGIINGKRGVSSTELSFPLSDIVLSDSGSITIKLQHRMSLDSLPGLTDVGIEITGE